MNQPTEISNRASVSQRVHPAVEKQNVTLKKKNGRENQSVYMPRCCKIYLRVGQRLSFDACFPLLFLHSPRRKRRQRGTRQQPIIDGGDTRNKEPKNVGPHRPRRKQMSNLSTNGGSSVSRNRLYVIVFVFLFVCCLPEEHFFFDIQYRLRQVGLTHASCVVRCLSCRVSLLPPPTPGFLHRGHGSDIVYGQIGQINICDRNYTDFLSARSINCLSSWYVTRSEQFTPDEPLSSFMHRHVATHERTYNDATRILCHAGKHFSARPMGYGSRAVKFWALT